MYEFVRRRSSGGIERVPFPSKAFVVGSDLAADVQVDGLAPHHAQFTVDGRGRIFVRDLSGGQTTVDGQSVTEAEVRIGARLRLGTFSLEVQLLGAPLDEVAEPLGNTLVSSAALKQVGRPGPVGSLEPGSLVAGRYRIERLIAKGGMGEVYEAVHVELERVVALKVMLASLSNDPQFVSRFKTEAMAAGRIGNQHIIDVLDSGQTGEGRFFFTMEYLKGRTLTDVIAREAPLAVSRVAAIGAQVAKALAAAHREGIVHRDLKPDNVMLVERSDQAEFVKVVDFGVAKVGHVGANTALGTMMGTPLYMAPEQARGQRVDRRADLYSLGLMLHEMLTGQAVFAAENSMRVIDRQLHEPAPRLRSSVPAPLRELVAKLLEKAEDARPQSATEVVAVLEQLSARTPRRIIALAWALGLSAVVGLVTVTALSLHGDAPVATPPPEAVPLAPSTAPEPPVAQSPLPARATPSAEPHPAGSRPPPKASSVPGKQVAAPGSVTELERGDLAVGVGASRLVHVEGVTRVASADEKIASVSLVGGEVKIVGRRAGNTDLVLMTDKGSLFKKVHVK